MMVQLTLCRENTDSWAGAMVFPRRKWCAQGIHLQSWAFWRGSSITMSGNCGDGSWCWFRQREVEGKINTAPFLGQVGQNLVT